MLYLLELFNFFLVFSFLFLRFYTLFSSFILAHFSNFFFRLITLIFWIFGACLIYRVFICFLLSYHVIQLLITDLVTTASLLKCIKQAIDFILLTWNIYWLQRAAWFSIIFQYCFFRCDIFIVFALNLFKIIYRIQYTAQILFIIILIYFIKFIQIF